MATAWLHIGWPKTGSTALQAALRDGKFDFVVPKPAGGPVLHQELVTALSDGAVASQTDSPADQSFRVYQDALETGKDVVISYEELSINGGLAERLMARLRRDFEHVQVICVVRPFGHWLPSCLTQVCREVSPRLPQIFPENHDLALVLQPGIAVLSALESWHKVVGADDMRFLNYEPHSSRNIVSQVLETIQGRYEQIPYQTHNASDGGAFTCLRLASLRHCGRAQDNASLRAGGAFIALSRQIRSAALSIDPALLDRLELQSRDTFDWIEEASGFELRNARPEGITIGSFEDVDRIAAHYLPQLLSEAGSVWGLTPHIDPRASLPEQLRDLMRYLAGIEKLPHLPTNFDPDRYLALHDDVAQAGVDPAEHFRAHGVFEGRHH